MLVQVRPQEALGALPVQTCGAAHVRVAYTKRQPSVSVAQVARVAVSWQTVPLAVQIAGLQEHDATLFLIPHVWCGPHVILATHAAHPFA